MHIAKHFRKVNYNSEHLTVKLSTRSALTGSHVFFHHFSVRYMTRLVCSSQCITAYITSQYYPVYSMYTTDNDDEDMGSVFGWHQPVSLSMSGFERLHLANVPVILEYRRGASIIPLTIIIIHSVSKKLCQSSFGNNAEHNFTLFGKQQPELIIKRLT